MRVLWGEHGLSAQRQMKDHQPNNQRMHYRAAICCSIFMFMTAGPAAVAQLTPATEIPSSRKPSQTTSGRSTAPNIEQVIINTELVTMTVSVLDGHGRYVPGLKKKDFTITDNKVPQQIAFFSDADIPVSVGIVFDVSGSMSGKKIERAKEALSNFIQTSHQDDEYFLIGFSAQPQLLDRSRDGDGIIKKLTFVEPHGSTALYDASYLALERVASGIHQKRAILIISDGQDNNSRYTFSQLRRALKESDVLIYAIGIEGPTPGDVSDFYGKMLLSNLAVNSGGRVFFPTNSIALTEAFENIALELRHQYSISYRPSNFRADGKWHRVKVKVRAPQELKRIFVRSREGYYAAESLR